MIYLPPPQPVINRDIRVSGDVEIHPTASIAPGVILQATPSQRIVIGADVCLGMGVIINAGEGSVEIDNGAIIGSGVLIIGQCKIGSNACIGTAVTVFQTDIEAMKVVEPGAILGDNSRRVDLNEGDCPQNPQAKSNSPTSDRPQNHHQQNSSRGGKNFYFSSQNGKTPSQNSVEPNNINPKKQEPASTQVPFANSAENTIQPNSNRDKESVVGQVYINQLLVTLFPHKQNLSSQKRKLE